MLKRSILLGLAALLVAGLSSCIFDPKPGEPPVIPPKNFVKKDLSHRTDVLNNIEYAYNKRDVSAYDELLDDNFTFFYTEADVGGSGGGTPIQWGRADEMTTTTGLLTPGTGADKIEMDILWEDGVTWGEQISNGETWQYTTVFYNFKIKIGDTTYIPNQGAKAQFTIRNAGTAEAPKWKLVEFHDLGGPS